jgi:23S rRNA pseudouridine2604 synthase
VLRTATAAGQPDHPAQRLDRDSSEVNFNPRHLKALQQAGALDAGSHGLLALTLDKKLARKLADAEQEYLIQLEAPGSRCSNSSCSS